MERSVRFAVEGLYVDRAKSNPNDKPAQWVRDWKTWMECSTIERCDAVLANGQKILVKDEYSGFSDLRIVRISETREVIHHDFK